ncbi:Hsp20/alpha crystallin family protein [Metabacillus sp. RGM 3146]|uniref:Hsp20/alpha crystallin family protein n=1 Tax=Metabacillus sp. RGM 3146 TaxID=3401092 RepID=UPI003B9D0676
MAANNRDNNPMKLINDFFQQRPDKTLLHTMDDLFQHPSKKSFFVETIESEKHFIVKAELPGIQKEEIHVDLLGNVLRIKVKRRKEKTDVIVGDPEKWDGVQRTVELPLEMQLKDMKAVHQDGILKVYFSKKKGRKIEID